MRKNILHEIGLELEKINFDDKIQKVIIRPRNYVGSKPEVLNFGKVEIYDFKYIGYIDILFRTKDGIFSASHWMHESAYLMIKLFEEKDSPATELDRLIFAEFKKVMQGLANVNNNLIVRDQSSLIDSYDKEGRLISKVLLQPKPYIDNRGYFSKTVLDYKVLFLEDGDSQMFTSIFDMNKLNDIKTDAIYDDLPRFELLAKYLFSNVEIEQVLDEELVSIAKDVMNYSAGMAKDTEKVEKLYANLDTETCRITKQQVFSSIHRYTINPVGLGYNIFEGLRKVKKDGKEFKLVVSADYTQSLKTIVTCHGTGSHFQAIFLDDLKNLLDLVDESEQETIIQFLKRSYYDMQILEDKTAPFYSPAYLRKKQRLNGIIGNENVEYVYTPIEEYDFKPEISFYSQSDERDELFLGVELEIDDSDDDEGTDESSLIGSVLKHGTDRDFVYMMHDGSLNNGFEIATMPATLGYHMNKVHYQEAFDLARDLGFRSHDTNTCGLHVHMNRDFFGHSRSVVYLKAAYMALILERNWEDVVTFSRRDYHDIEDWADKKDLNDVVSSLDDDDSLRGKFRDKYSGNKYVALNTQHSNSLEIRIFKGTLNYNTYIATLQFVSNLANIVKDCNSLAEAQQITFKDIIDYKEYNELRSFLNTRRF